ncbi:MAG: DUF2786 domain-containing protein [Alphaproteobacteria bacterium]|jgi:hypothetical protein|nr:DUF2786 domain-containing protein [Alphaproteobacteria bacterium]|tara:strand:- start:1217 stop:1594 length:378 start_codon:yes stop_codon:yes gene_type:complete
MATTAVDLGKLTKVLALTTSDQEGEAIAALRVARQLLERAGLTLVDLVRGGWAEGLTLTGTADAEAQDALERSLRQATDEMRRQRGMILELNRQIESLEVALNRSSRENQGWRQRAWQNLWDSEA